MRITNMHDMNTLVRGQPFNLYTCKAAVTFMDQSWFPCLRLAARHSLDSCYSSFSALYAIGAICSAMNQCLVNFYGSVVTYFILLFFSSTPYWFQSKVKPEGNQGPFMIPHISVSWSNKYQGSMMNCTQYELQCDTVYWSVHDWARFGVPVCLYHPAVVRLHHKPSRNTMLSSPHGSFKTLTKRWCNLCPSSLTSKFPRAQATFTGRWCLRAVWPLSIILEERYTTLTRKKTLTMQRNGTSHIQYY